MLCGRPHWGAEGGKNEETFFYLFSVISLSIIFTILGCKQNTESGESGGNYPILKISSSYDGYIYRVGLAGYSFDDLRIGNNEDKVFELKNGIPGGNSNVNVNINFRPDSIHIDSRSPLSVKCNFQDGKVTTIEIPNGTVRISD